MSKIEMVEAEIKELKKVAYGLPKGDLRNPLDKRIKKLQHKLNQLRKDNGRDTYETYKHLIFRHLRTYERFFIENVSTDGTLEGFVEWIKGLNQKKLEDIISKT